MKPYSKVFPKNLVSLNKNFSSNVAWSKGQNQIRDKHL